MIIALSLTFIYSCTEEPESLNPELLFGQWQERSALFKISFSDKKKKSQFPDRVYTSSSNTYFVFNPDGTGYYWGRSQGPYWNSDDTLETEWNLNNRYLEVKWKVPTSQVDTTYYQATFSGEILFLTEDVLEIDRMGHSDAPLEIEYIFYFTKSSK